MTFAELFQSTHPVWDATQEGVHTIGKSGISIHASRMGCDTKSEQIHQRVSTNFNPRIPYGMRLAAVENNNVAKNFNPRIPYGMRPPPPNQNPDIDQDFNPRIPYGMRHFEPIRCLLFLNRFQSTHPVWDATFSKLTLALSFRYFNPRIPYGMRRAGLYQRCRSG